MASTQQTAVPQEPRLLARQAQEVPRAVLPKPSPPQVTRHPLTGLPPAAGKPKLMDRLREALRSRHYSPRTEQTYSHWVKRFIFFHNIRHPTEMPALSSAEAAEPEVNAFLTHLATKGKVSASTQNQALSALLFLYRYVLDHPLGQLGEVVRARKPHRLPVVLTRQEVRAVLSRLEEDRWLMASLMYGAGLRLAECLRLRVQDVDLEANQILVRDGKGFKDRRRQDHHGLHPCFEPGRTRRPEPGGFPGGSPRRGRDTRKPDNTPMRLEAAAKRLDITHLD